MTGRDESLTRSHLLPGARVLEPVLLALASTSFWYFCYFLAAPWIWRQNIAFRPEDITPWIRMATNEHDGIEIYALYLVMFLNLLTTLGLDALVRRLNGQGARRAVLGVAGAASLALCLAVRFIPPMHTLGDIGIGTGIWQILLIAAATVPGIAALCALHRIAPRLALGLGALMLVPPCALVVANFGWRDYTFIFAPALRLLDGAAPSQIYFQYDLLPSLMAALWMKLGIDLNTFRILGQVSYYLALLGVFLLSSRLFQKKELSYFLLAALILGRLYATPFDITLTFQTTPVRLDLWLPLLFIVYRLGPYHWLAGLTCGLLVLLIKNFGIIYSLAYIQLLLALWVVRYLDEEGDGSLVESLVRHARRCAVPVATIACFAVASHFLFRNEQYGNFAGYYQKIGIGFMQIARDSFYWYIPPVFGTVFVLLFRLRRTLSQQYLTTALFLLLCGIGNSIYFFGRSHEHNIINIAIVLLFVFFLMLDLITRAMGPDADDSDSFLRRNLALVAASLLIGVIIVSYSDSIAKKGTIQYLNVANGSIFYTAVHPEEYEGFFGKIREVTGGSRKVYFVHESDFALYYYGGYQQVGYCNPYLTWIFSKDLHKFLQDLLNQGYYLVCGPKQREMLDGLRYGYQTPVGETLVLAKLPPKPGNDVPQPVKAATDAPQAPAAR